MDLLAANAFATMISASSFLSCHSIAQGLYISFFGKVTSEKILQIGSSLVTVLGILAQALAPAEKAWEQEMLQLQNEVIELKKLVTETCRSS